MRRSNNTPQLTEAEIAIQRIESGEISDVEWFEELARAEAANSAKVVPQVFGGMGLVAFGFLLQLSTFQLGGLILMAVWMVASKIRRAYKGDDDIDAGNVEEYLPRAEIEHYRLAKKLEAEERARQRQAAQSQTVSSQAIAPTSSPLPAAQQTTRPTAAPPTVPPLPALKLDELRHYPSLIIFGAQGSGKTSLARAIAHDRMAHGHDIDVLDPHGIQWAQFPVIGAGMDYPAIENACQTFRDEIFKRYGEAVKRQQQGKAEGLSQADIERRAFEFTPRTMIADEFTNWSSSLNSKIAVEFLKRAWTDTRKIRLHTIFISHSNTLEGGLARAKGLADLRDTGCYQIELFAKSVEGHAVPTGEGLLYRPNQSPVKVCIPVLQSPQAQETVAISANQNSQSPAENLNDLNAGSNSVPDRPVQPFEPLNASEPVVEPRSNGSEPQLNDAEPPPEPPLNPHLNGLSERDRAHLLHAQGMSRDEIIVQIWNVKKGGSKRYAEGKDKLRGWLGL